MSLIQKDAEKILRQKLQDYFFQDPYKRVIFLRLSQIQIEQNDWPNIISHAAKIFFPDDPCEIYICFDKDVFIVNRTATFKKLEQFLTHLTKKLSPASPTGLASLFEVGVDLERLRQLCTRKIKIIEQPAEAKKTETQNAINPVDHIDHQLLNTLNARRKERKQPEIMIVEDDPFSQKLIHNAIGKNYTLTLTSDGRGAIMNYIAKAPDVLFLDIGLPDMDGHEVLRKIFEIDPNAFVVMFSGKGDRENVTRAVQTGAKGFVGKPFTKEKLFQYIDKSPFIIEKRERA